MFIKIVLPICDKDMDLSLDQQRLGPNTTARFAAVILFISQRSTTWIKARLTGKQIIVWPL